MIMKWIKERISRREFLKSMGAGAGAIGVSVALPRVLSAASVDLSNAPAADKKQLIAALGDIIVPTAQDDPGYKSLEQYGITDEVLKGLQGISQQDCNVFNAAAGEFYNGKGFLDLNEEQRTEFVHRVVDSTPKGSYVGGLKYGAELEVQEATPAAAAALAAKFDAGVVQTLQKVFRFTRSRVFLVYYQNFPENHIARDKNKIPILPPGDQHQIINPNTKELVTGWDVANFPGPLSWQEEESRRAKWMKIHWHND